MAGGYIFDLDGTLLDTEVLWVEATEAFLLDGGVEVTHEWARDVVYGRSWHDVYKSICARYPELGMSLPRMQDAMDPYFRRLRDSRDVRITGSIDLLLRLSSTAPVCIVSGSPRRDVEYAVEALGVRDILAFTLASEDYSPGKPDPACYRMAAEQLGLPPGSCVVFEDSAVGIQAAKAAGMQCVVLVRDGRPEQDVSGADLVLTDLADYAE